jgi:hypothetical protein
MTARLYLGAVHFDGDPEQLLPAYHRLFERFPLDGLDLHVCVRRDGGLTVFDACPTRAIYESFTTSETFLGAVAAAGLPAPRVEALGDVEVAHLRGPRP